MIIVGVIKRMKHGHFPWRSLLMFASRELSFLTFPLAKKLSNSCGEFLWRCIFLVSNKDRRAIRLTFTWEINSLRRSHHEINNQNIKHVEWWASQTGRWGRGSHKAFTRHGALQHKRWHDVTNIYRQPTRRTVRFKAALLMSCKPTGCLLKRGRLLMWQ